MGPSSTRDPAEALLLRILSDSHEDEEAQTSLLEALTDRSAIDRAVAARQEGPPKALFVGQCVRLIDRLSVAAMRGGPTAAAALTLIEAAFVEIDRRLASSSGPGRPGTGFVASALGFDGLLLENLDRSTPAALARTRAEYQAWSGAAPGLAEWLGAERIAARIVGYLGFGYPRSLGSVQWVRERFDEPFLRFYEGDSSSVLVWAALHGGFYRAFVDRSDVDAVVPALESEVLTLARRDRTRGRDRLGTAVSAAPEALRVRVEGFARRL